MRSGAKGDVELIRSPRASTRENAALDLKSVPYPFEYNRSATDLRTSRMLVFFAISTGAKTKIRWQR